MKFVKTAICLSALMGFSFAAAAGDGPNQKQIDNRFNKLDINADGVIDLAEYTAFRA